MELRKIVELEGRYKRHFVDEVNENYLIIENDDGNYYTVSSALPDGFAEIKTNIKKDLKKELELESKKTKTLGAKKRKTV